LPGPWAITASGCAGRSGDADIKPAPVPATTDHKPPGNREDRDLRLEYQPQHFMVAPCLRSGARQWRRDPVTVLRALAPLTRMVRDDCAGGEARGRRVEQSAWVVLWLVRADYPLASRRRSELPAFAAASHLARSGTRSEGAGDGGRNGPGTPGI
jgi:hypothetical protein